ncbi:hypothetical protein [Streptomyces sp. NPDC026673]|uniref:hypothetical protein n=1 Tax=Streptomyces sp. NPDC026673 TaxID=3155724 RepID=UPI0033CD9D70
MAPTRASLVLWSAAGLAGMVALVGCSQGDAESAPPTTSSTSSSPSRAAANGELAIPDGADEETKKAYLLENAVAACMRKQGFSYTPHVTDWGPSVPVDGQDYELAKKYREKYGFGLYAAAAYPDDPTLFGTDAYEAKVMADPNDAYLAALSPAQRKAYDKALGNGRRRTADGKAVELPGCKLSGFEKVYGPEKSQAEIDRESASAKEQDRAAEQALNGDPKLISLAQEFAACLRNEGIAVTTTQPTAIGDMVKFATSAQLPPSGIKGLDKDDAQAKFAQEISNARKDLECGKKFRAAYFPKLAKHPFSGITG